MTAPPIVVVGGGLAGVTAAVELADAGRRVVLLESRARLGGRAGSGQRHGLPVDTGAHVALRCYERYFGLLDRLGVAHLVPIQERMRIPVLLPGGQAAALVRGRHGPAPLHLAGTLGRYAGLSPAERLSALRAANRLRRVDPTRPGADQRTFGDWLSTQGQGARAVRRLWGLLTVAALNLEPDEASLALAAMVFRTAFFDDVRGADIGVPAGPLCDLHDRPVRALLEGLGVRLHTGTRVLEIDRGGEASDDGLVLSVRTEGGGAVQTLTAEAVVLAVPHREASRLAPATACPEREQWDRLGCSPILNVHVHLDRRVSSHPFAAAPDSRVQWVFDRTTESGIERGQYLVTSVSAAHRLATAPAEEVLTEQLEALRQLFPAARAAEVLDAFVTREPRATFRQAAGTAAWRPSAPTRWPRLVLAGAWTATGWPDTLEGAVRSGHAAAEHLLSPAAQRHTKDHEVEVPA